MSVRLSRRAGVLAAVATAAAFAQFAMSTPAQAAPTTPLPSQSPVTRQEPAIGASHAYNSTTTPFFWSVVAVRPHGTSDLDLDLSDANGNLLASSVRGVNSDGYADVDFVAIDSNAAKHPAGNHISRVRKFSGAVTWEYTAEFVDPHKELKPGPNNTMSIAGGHVADIADLQLQGGQTVTITVQPSVPGQYPELFLMGSTSAPDSVVPSQHALAHASAPKTNTKAISVTFTADHPDYYGVVLVNKTVPPTGAIPPGGTFKVTVS